MSPRNALIPIASLVAALSLVQAAFGQAQTAERAKPTEQGQAPNSAHAVLATANVPPLRPVVSQVEAGPSSAAARATHDARRRHAARFLVADVRGEAVLRTRPGGQAAVRVGPRTEFGSAQVLSIAARRGPWLGVLTPALPNGKLGWVRRGDPALALRRLDWSLHADLSSRTLELRRGAKVLERASVGVGQPGSPTPPGRFSVTDKLTGFRFGPYYGCCILALSGHQPRPPAGWSGGTRLAVHGTNSPQTIGRAASAGCLRAEEGALRRLMRQVPLGTPVYVRR